MGWGARARNRRQPEQRPEAPQWERDARRYERRMHTARPDLSSRQAGIGPAAARAGALRPGFRDVRDMSGRRYGLTELDFWVLLRRNLYLNELLVRESIGADDRYVDLLARVLAAANDTVIENSAVFRGVCCPVSELARYRAGADVVLDRLTFAAADREYARFFTFPKNAAGDVFPRPAGHVGLVLEFAGAPPVRPRQRGLVVPLGLTLYPIARREIVLPPVSPYRVRRAPAMDEFGLYVVTLESTDGGLDSTSPSGRVPAMTPHEKACAAAGWKALCSGGG